MVSTDKKRSCCHFASWNIKITNAIRRIYYIQIKPSVANISSYSASNQAN